MKLKHTNNVKLADVPVWTEGEINQIRGQLGWEAILIPVNYRSKEIRYAGWKEVTRADMEKPEYMELLMRSNIGVAMGKMSGHLVVIDCDFEEAKKDWIEPNPMLKNTLATQGQPGRISLWIRIRGGKYPDQTVNIPKYGEWRAGHGSQTIFAGIHPDTQEPYQIVQDFPVLTVAIDQIQFPDKIKSKLYGATGEPVSTGTDATPVVDTSPETQPIIGVANDSPTVTPHTDYCIELESTVQKRRRGRSSSIASIQYPKEGSVPTDSKDREAMLAFLTREMPKNGHGQAGRALDFYWNMVGKRYPAKEETRNTMLVNFSMIAVTAIHPGLATLFMSLWYCTTKARGKWKESYDSHMRKFLDAISTRIEEYPGSLRNLSPKFTNDELEVYKGLPERDTVAFRIIRNLALQQGEKDGKFFLGEAQFEMRLMKYAGFASQVFSRFQINGIIQLMEKGDQYKEGLKAKTSVWAYLLAGSYAQRFDEPF